MLGLAIPARSLLQKRPEQQFTISLPLLSVAKNESHACSKEAKRSFCLVCATVGENKSLTGISFDHFGNVKEELELLPARPDVSMARHKYSDACEAAINEHISTEYNVSYFYHALFAYFDRDNVALKGLARFFRISSVEERLHAEKFMEYQNKRGGKVILQPIAMPPSDFAHAEKGDALYAMELALCLEKLTNEKLLKLHAVAEKNLDAQLADFIATEFLEEQVASIEKIAELVAQLRRVGTGDGLWQFDQMLLKEETLTA